MPARERAVDRGARAGARLVRDAGEEVRRARIAAGLSQGAIARAMSVSHSTISRLERGAVRNVSVLELARAAAVVGLELTVRAYPVASPLRDHAHAVVEDRFRALFHPSIASRSEAPFPNPGDLRSWDLLLRAGRCRTGVEVETRPRDGQELERRMALKRRDGGVNFLILVLPDTRSNRALVRDRAASLSALFPGDASRAVAELGAGRLPEEDVMMLL